MDFKFDIGLSKPSASYTMDDKEELLKDIIGYYTVYQTVREISEFTNGFLSRLSMKAFSTKMKHYPLALGCLDVSYWK